MSTPILATKLYIPPPRTDLVHRPRLIEELNAGLRRKLTLISAPAGFGKTTLVSEWVTKGERQVAWLALDEADNDPTRFLTYLVAALQTLALADSGFGKGVLALLQSAQPPPTAVLLTTLLNEINTIADHFLLVLDDYHLIDAGTVDAALTFLLEHLPPQLHLVITTREDPPLPLARLRARAQLTEVRAADLRFTPEEAAAFLNQVMGLHLTAEETAALEARTEGWIAGLQLAAVSMQGHNAGAEERAAFIQSFTGNHRFVMDYLVEEVLHQQPEPLQRFLLQTAILDRMCGPLCDALLCQPTATGQKTLETLEQANLFLIPLDNERRWYRYHHLFAELLRQRLQQMLAEAAGGYVDVAELHRRASQWYEENDLELEAFHHATLAHDVERAERLIEGKGMPLHFRGAIMPVLNWLKTLAPTVLDAHPSLWLAYGSTLLVTGQGTRAQEVLDAAERVLQTKETTMGWDDQDRDLIGRLAAIRATIAAGLQQVDRLITQSERALAHLHPNNLAFRTSTNWKLGYAYHLGREYGAAKQAYQEAITKGQATGNTIFTIMSLIGLAHIYQIETQLPKAVEYYRRALDLFGEQALPSAGEAYAGLAQVYYEWNKLDAARRYAQQSLAMARQWEKSDSPLLSELILARLTLIRGDVTGAAAQLAQTASFMRQTKLTHRLDEVVATQVQTLLAQNKVAEASALAQSPDLPLSQARVCLMQGDHRRALTLLESAQHKLKAQGRIDRMLKAMVLQAVAHQAGGQGEQALALLGETVALAEPGGLIRLFVDEGLPVAQLLTKLLPIATRHGATPDYIHSLLAAFGAAEEATVDDATLSIPTGDQPLAEPLSEREIEVLQLIAAGHKNQEIADALVVSLNTVRYHTKNLYGKLGVNKRTQAVAKAQALGLI